MGIVDLVDAWDRVAGTDDTGDCRGLGPVIGEPVLAAPEQARPPADRVFGAAADEVAVERGRRQCHYDGRAERIREECAVEAGRGPAATDVGQELWGDE